MRLPQPLTVAILVSLLPGCALAQQKVPAKRAEIVGYFTEFGVRPGGYTVKDLVSSGAAARLTQIDYAFGLVADNQCRISDAEKSIAHPYTAEESVNGVADDTGPGQLRGTFHQLQELKRRYPALKVVISFGGWGRSGGFSSAADPENMRDFVRSCVNTFIHGHFAPGIEAPGIFDGIDLDWEYPVQGGPSPGRPEDRQNFTALAAEFRRQLDSVRPGLLLTAAIPAEEELFKNFDLPGLVPFLDQFGIMAYDEHWSTEPITNLHSSLFHDPKDPSAPPNDKHYGDYAVQGFIAAGVPRNKIILGVPFYGKGWAGVSDVNHGLYQKASGAADGAGYKQLKSLAGADRKFYPRLGTCTIWSQGTFWSYDCPEALRMKMKYVRQQKLGGVMFWELGHDTSNGELLKTLGGE
jgi:chitinase